MISPPRGPLPTTPLCSFVTSTRNDGYAGGVPRLRFALDLLLSQCDACELPAEVILVEWNPPLDRPPLVEALGRLPQSDFTTVRVVTVPGSFHRRYERHEVTPIHTAVAANVGLRRARGRYRQYRVADAFYSDAFLEWLAQEGPRPGVLYRCARHDVEPSISEQSYSDRGALFAAAESLVVDRHSHLARGFTPFRMPDLFLDACGDFQLMDAESWERVRAYPETSDPISYEADALIAHSAYALGIEERLLPPEVRVYKILHHETFSARTGTTHHQLSGLRRRLHGLLMRIQDPRRRDPLEFAFHAVFDYPRVRTRGVDKWSPQRSLLRFKLVSALPSLVRLKPLNWGLAGVALPEHTLNLARWDTPQPPVGSSRPRLGV